MSIIQKRLYRSREDRMLSGFLGGIAAYFGGIDPTIVRLGFVFLTIVTGVIPGVVTYIIGAIIVPEEPEASASAASEASPSTAD